MSNDRTPLLELLNDHVLRRAAETARARLRQVAGSPAELRRQSEALLAHARRARGDAERARQNALQCRDYADAARNTAKLRRAHSEAAQGRQNAR